MSILAAPSVAGHTFDRSAATAANLNRPKTFVLFFLLSLTFAASAFSAEIQYNRDVRPILAEHCFRCHGPDAATRQSDLRLDEHEDAVAQRGGYRVIDPGRSHLSELITRVTSKEDDERMPPADSGSALQAKDIEMLRKWIDQGARYQPHWAFLPLRRPSIPQVRRSNWVQNAVDHFVLSRLQDEGLSPASVAEPAILMRRVTLGLTGLPPTLEEIDEFELEYAVSANRAYVDLVDRLLASPRYGERMAVGWLDAARYADTNGYFTDNDRSMWPWRDWVICAFNANLPFDQFTIDQLAGDLLPEATESQRIATGFNRNHMINNETGIIEEEFRVEYVADRVDTTATVWMGLTLSCARCHDHKYDPISQHEFYRFFALFNNVPERGLSGSQGNAAPFLKVPSEQQQARLVQLGKQIQEAEQQFVPIEKALAEAQTQWEATALIHSNTFEPPGLIAHFELDGNNASENVAENVTFGRGMVGKAAKFQGDSYIPILDEIDLRRDRAFSFSAWIKPQGAGCVVSKIDDANDMRGFDVVLRKSKVVVDLVHRYNRNAIQVSTVSSVANGQWQHLTVTYDGSSRASGVSVYLDGQRQPTAIGHDSLSGTIQNDQPLRVGRRQASASYTGMIDDLRFYARQLRGDEVESLATDQLVRGIAGSDVGQRSAAQKRKLRAVFLAHHADQRHAAAWRRLDELRRRQQDLLANVPTTMVMQESKEPPAAFVLLGGQYDQHGPQVTPGVPKFLSAEQAASRVEMAKWLVDPSHPLTARVTVNRLWQRLFGTGIVKTVDDFGTQGDWPSHSELLDWLAVEFIECGWDVKHLMRLMVLSQTYRQSSLCSPQLRQLDRDNRMLARGPRFRMGAEMIRDNALAISGLLVEKQGGPSVMPYQPAGVWADVTYDSNRGYQSDSGESLYRRSMYTFWKRQAPPSNMLVFDAPTRETCSVTRGATNTPLQALVLMNDPTFVEASRQLAAWAMSQATGGDDASRVGAAFRLATSRNPTADETAVLLGVLRQQLAFYSLHADQARQLVSVGESPKSESPKSESIDDGKLASWTTLTSMILSLDETITRP